MNNGFKIGDTVQDQRGLEVLVLDAPYESNLGKQFRGRVVTIPSSVTYYTLFSIGGVHNFMCDSFFIPENPNKPDVRSNIYRDAYIPEANITPQDFINEFKKLNNE